MKIASIAPLAYTPGNLEYFNFIRSGSGAEYHQNPILHQFPNGKLMIYWGAYDYNECNNNGIMLYSISTDRGINWSAPQVYMADYPSGVPFYIRFLNLHGSKNVLMLVTQQLMDELEIDESRREAVSGGDYFRSRTRIIQRSSTDGGRIFDHGHELPYEIVSGGKELPHVGFYGDIDELIQLDGGRILAGFAFIDPERSNSAAKDVPYWKRQYFTTVCIYSDDQGKTWKRSNEITVDLDRGAMEPQIVEVAPDQLLCMFRTKGGYLYQSESKDGGQTWSASVASSLPSPESMPRMIKLLSGHLLIVWNNVSSTTQQPRHPLSAAISRDGGKSWSKPRIIAEETGENQLTNQALIQLDDGRILLGISRYRATRPHVSDVDVAIFDEAWVLGS